MKPESEVIAELLVATGLCEVWDAVLSHEKSYKSGQLEELEGIIIETIYEDWPPCTVVFERDDRRVKITFVNGEVMALEKQGTNFVRKSLLRKAASL